MATTKKYNQTKPKYNFKDMTGLKFGRLTVISRAENDRHGNVMWNCKCDCGTDKIINGASLRRASVLSCGCLHKEIVKTKSKKHGLVKHRIYTIWYDMKARCYNAKNPHFNCYGGRGIKNCEEWLNSENGFQNYAKWSFENGYKEDLTIDRIDNDANYEPNNCRWVTRKVQAQNKRNTMLLLYNGNLMTISEIAKITHKSWNTIKNQIEKGEFNLGI